MQYDHVFLTTLVMLSHKKREVWSVEKCMNRFWFKPQNFTFFFSLLFSVCLFFVKELSERLAGSTNFVDSRSGVSFLFFLSV